MIGAEFKAPAVDSDNVLDDIGNFFPKAPLGRGISGGAAFVTPSPILPVVGKVTVGGGAAVGCVVGAGSTLGTGYNVTSVTSYK